MKIIDLLNKIANGEEIPRFRYEGTRYMYSYANEMFVDLDDDESKTEIYFSELNDEVEVIEEEPKDIELCGPWFTKSKYDKLAKKEDKKIKKMYYMDHSDETDRLIIIRDKINEIIEVINNGI